MHWGYDKFHFTHTEYLSLLLFRLEADLKIKTFEFLKSILRILIKNSYLIIKFGMTFL